MLEDERPNSLFTGNLTGWRNHMGMDSDSQEADPLLDKVYRPIAPCSPAATKALPLYAFPTSRFPSWLSNDKLTDYNKVVRANASTAIGALLSTSSSSIRLPPVASRAGYTGSFNYLPVYSELDWPYSVWYNRSFVTYYVATNGNDNNNGSFQFPFATIQKAHDATLPGDTIYIRNGTYNQQIAVWKPNVTFATFPGDLPNKAKIVSPNNDPNIVNCVTFKGGSGSNKLSNLDISGGYYYAIMFNQAGGGANNLYWNWYRSTLKQTTVISTVIEYCNIHHSGTNVIKLSPYSNDIIFRYNEISFSGQRGSATVDPVPVVSNNPTEDTGESAPKIEVTNVQGNGKF